MGKKSHADGERCIESLKKCTTVSEEGTVVKQTVSPFSLELEEMMRQIDELLKSSPFEPPIPKPPKAETDGAVRAKHGDGETAATFVHKDFPNGRRFCAVRVPINAPRTKKEWKP